MQVAAPMQPTGELKRIADQHPHIRAHVMAFQQEFGIMPEYLNEIDRGLGGRRKGSFIYPVGDPVYIHIHFDRGTGVALYYSLEPNLSQDEERLYVQVKRKLLIRSAYQKELDEDVNFDEVFQQLIEDVLAVKPSQLDRLLRRRIKVTNLTRQKILYRAYRDFIGNGKIEGILRDPWLEDIHCVGLERIYLQHKVFGMMETNVVFDSDDDTDTYLSALGERMGRPIGTTSPIVDGVVPGGSRINVVFGRDVSGRGSSFTIRRFTNDTISVIQLLQWKSWSPTGGAFLWMILEFGMNVFVAGETASGKTTAINALLAFVPDEKKIFTAEDTPEVQPPHRTWQQLITRETGPEESHVDMMDLLKAALRSRPDLIIVGEIRGEEGAVAFQAMQTGHPVMATFHASNVRKLVQRFTGHPINVPITFMDNLNLVLFHAAIPVRGKMLRRCTNIDEITGYSKKAGTILTRRMFDWDPMSDEMSFSGKFNSYLLEEVVAPTRGYDDKRQIYDELREREGVLRKMMELNIVDNREVVSLITDYRKIGLESLPFEIDPEYVFHRDAE